RLHAASQPGWFAPDRDRPGGAARAARPGVRGCRCRAGRRSHDAGAQRLVHPASRGRFPMTHVLLIFLDGIGLGDDDPATNPFAAAHTPTPNALAGGHNWLRTTPRIDTGRALFIPTDPRLAVPGRPQSATGQAAIL